MQRPFLYAIIILFAIACTNGSNPTGVYTSRSGYEFSIMLEDNPAEGVTWYDFELRNITGSNIRVDAYYEGEHIGIAKQFGSDSNSVHSATFQLNTLGLPATAELEFIVTDNQSRRDTLAPINVPVVQTQMTELTAGDAGINPNFFDIFNFVQGSDGTIYFATYAGLMIIESDLTITGHEWSGLWWQTAITQHVFLTDDERVRLTDSRGNLVELVNGSLQDIAIIDTLAETGAQILIHSGGEYFWSKAGDMYRYQPDQDTTMKYSLAGLHDLNTVLTTGPDGQIFAAFRPFGADSFHLFEFANEQWREIPLPEGEIGDRFDDHRFGRIAAIVTDHNGTIWMARGLSIFEYDGQNFIQHRLPDQRYSIGPSTGCYNRGIINDLYADPAGNIWLAANDRGLYRWNEDRHYVYPPTSLSVEYRTCSVGVGSSFGTPVVTRLFPGAGETFFTQSKGRTAGVLTHIARTVPE